MPPISQSVLEDLSNELFYEIFQYLDTFDFYKGFYNLNERLQNLLCKSSIPLKITLSLISKSNFEQYNRQLLIPNRHRIQSLYISNLFIVDSIFVPVKTASSFLRLETLIFDCVKPKYFPNIFRYLATLPNLSTLILLSIDCSDDLFELIFRLPKLKYCKISFESSSETSLTLPRTKQTSSIEHLVIDYRFKLKDFIDLLSYLPHLQYLSINSLDGMYKYPITTNGPIKPNHLKKVQFDFLRISFDQFELISRHLFNQLEILRLFIHAENIPYLDAHRWEQLISFSMPKLRIFDYEYRADISIDNDEPYLMYGSIRNDFSTLFWIQRKWFFDYQVCGDIWGCHVSFYSIGSRRNKFVLRKQFVEYFHEKPNVYYVDHIEIRSEETMLSCSCYFPRVTQLTLFENFSDSQTSLASNLNNLMPLTQLTILTIAENNFCMEQFIRLLHAMPNIRMLDFHCRSISEEGLMEMKETEMFKSVSKTNKINSIKICGRRLLVDIKLFTSLCPQLQCLAIDVPSSATETTVRYIMSSKRTNLPHLCILHMRCITKSHASVLRAFVKREPLLNNCYTKYIGDDFYFWC